MNPGEVWVWRARLDELRDPELPQPTPGELERAAALRFAGDRQNYLRAHRVLRAVLGARSAAPLEFAVSRTGKPYLANVPALRFNLSRTHGMALVAVALEVEVGVDVERLRPLPEHDAIASRFFPPSELAALAETPEGERERQFFRHWTRLEARLKAYGTGLFGAGVELAGEWTLRDIDVGEGLAAAVAATRAGMNVVVRDFGAAG